MKARLDSLLVNRGLAATRTQAQRLIMAGSVLVEGTAATKAGQAFDERVAITIKERYPYVSRGATKLMAALDEFGLDLSGLVAIDVGASTGGFTDLMLARGAARVYAVDVGKGQLHWKLRNDARVVCLENVNVRYLEPQLIPEPCDLATFDVSFISLKLVIPPVLAVLKENAAIITLIKPQFEAGRNQVGRGGIVKDPAVAVQVIEDMQILFEELGFTVEGYIPSPIKGAKGNQEYLAYAYRGPAR